MISTSEAPLAGYYWPTVALTLVALCPNLVLSTALELVNPTIAASFGVSDAEVSRASTLSNAAFAFGVVLSADLARRFKNRSLFLGYLGLFVVGSFAGALAPSLPVLIGGHVLQGLATGLLLVAALPPLVTKFPVHRLRSTIVCAVLGLFGAVTAGPLVGGYVAQTDTWRWLFTTSGALGVVALLLALLVLPGDPAPEPNARIDISAILLAAFGTGLTFHGVGQLTDQEWNSPRVYVPVVLGFLALAGLLILEALRNEPLMPVRLLTSTFPVMGILAAVISGAVFTSLLQLVLLFLRQIRGLDPQTAGLLLWPSLVMGILGAFVVGSVLTSRWVLTMPLFGMLCLALVAWQLTDVTSEAHNGEILWISGVLGLGASLTVAPGLLMAALSVTPTYVGRAIALVQMLRLISAYALGPVLLYFATNYGMQLLDGLHLMFWVLFGITLAGIALNTLIFIVGGARLHPPELQAFLEQDEPAFESPPIREQD